ncbi:hypothetical protein DH2020_018176 [Rehmannia glutinosa]|uniref:U-box domain-containing protein n=1 Tax=Rehmannia glutinosa TaxID=99300 RepID=A0ABR0WJJ8_REHGL
MKDPVTIVTGITYDRDSIEKWIFSQKNNNCPVTKQVILFRCGGGSDAEHHSPPSDPIVVHSPRRPGHRTAADPKTAGTAEFLASLIVKNTLRASRSESSSEEDFSDLIKASEEALSVLYGLQLSESGLKSLTLNGEFLESLTRFMQYASYESRVYAVMMLKSMLEVADPAQLINLRPEFFVELAQILRDQHVCQNASKATLKILICVCPWGRNKMKAVEAGIVPILIDLLLDSSDKRACEMMLMVLDLMCQCADGRSELTKHGAGLAIVSKKILRISHVASERAVRILHSVSKFSATHGILQEMLQIGVVAKLCLVLQVDCGVKTKERAREILKLHARAWRNSSCIHNSLISSYPS